MPWDKVMDEATLEHHLATTVPGLGPTQRRWVLEAMAVAAYHAQPGYPMVRLLVCDDAHAFNSVTDELALCWIHEGRHYAKLDSLLIHNRRLLRRFGDRHSATTAVGGSTGVTTTSPKPITVMFLIDDSDSLLEFVESLVGAVHSVISSLDLPLTTARAAPPRTGSSSHVRYCGMSNTTMPARRKGPLPRMLYVDRFRVMSTFPHP